MARLIPVLDVMGGRVVRAVGGRRGDYRPVVSRLTDSTEPVEVARKLLEVTGASELYVADLDAITATGSMPATDLSATRAEVWLDRGIRTFDDLERWPAPPAWLPVLGSETIREPARLARSMFVQGYDGVVSVDLKDGQVVGGYGGEVSYKAASFIDTFASVGCCRAVILLDLTAVGEGRGPGSVVFYLLDQLRHEYPEIEFVAGGGVRHRSDVQGLFGAGADAVLVASALHDGTLP